LNRALIVQPDGTITLRLLGQVHATGRTVDELRLALDEQYKKYYKVPAITVTPLAVNAKLEDLRYTIGGRSGLGGQSLPAKVTPEGTVTLPAVGVIPCQGLTLKELTEELAERYNAEIEGIEVIPILTQRAPRYVFVVGEVALPGRYSLEGPTTVMQAIAMAGSWKVGANVCQVVVFRRAEDWRLVATMLDLRPALLGKTPCPAGEIWIGDCDLVIVPKSKILLADNFIELVFTKGIYGVIPFSTNYSITNLTTLTQ
jgi:polysaccharide export outer membrane protein